MKDATEFPKRMVHPAHVKGTTTRIAGSEVYRPDGSIKFADYQGTPDRYPPVDVINEDEEDQYRAKGYKAYGEPDMNAIGFVEYPKMMIHPQHEAAVEAIVETRNGAGQLLSAGIPGRPAKFPARTVNSPREEHAAKAEGYDVPGRQDPEAVAAAKASPYVPGRVTNEYPKMVDGKLVQDPAINLNAAKEYPKWLNIPGHPQGGKEVRNLAEEEAILGPRAAPSKDDLARAKREAALKAKAAAEAALAAADAELSAGEVPQPSAPAPVVVSQDAPAQPVPQETPETGTRAAVVAELQRRGITFNKFWKIDKLKLALEQGSRAA